MHHVRAFAREHPDPWAVTHRDVEERLGRCRKPEYARSVRGALRCFYRWAIRYGLTAADPTAAVDPIRIPKPHARPCPDSVLEVAMMTAAPDVRLMMMLMADCGLRRFEVAKCHTDHIDGHFLWVMDGKGGKSARVAMSERVEAELVHRPRGHVFPSPVRPGKPVSADYVGHHVALALGGGWTAHNLRHYCGTRLYRRTGDIYLSQQQLRHSSVATTQRYVQPSDERLVAAVRAS